MSKKILASGTDVIVRCDELRLEQLLEETQALLSQVDDGGLIEWTLAENKQAARAAAAKYDRIERAFQRDMHKHLDDLLSGKVTGDQAYKAMKDTMKKAHWNAYLAGKETQLGKVTNITQGDIAYLARANAYEQKFLRGFIDDILSGKGIMPYHARMDLYAGSLRAFYHNGMVEYAPDEVEIYWRLGIAEHCEDCLMLEGMNPWTKANLPTVPGAGDTKCLGRCKCRLEYSLKKKKQIKRQLKKTVKGGRPKDIKDIFRLPAPPRGLRLPKANERYAIESIRQEMNYWRRAAAEAHAMGDDAALEAALKKRRELNKKLVDVMNKKKIWSPPALSVEEVISGKVLDERLVNQLFSLGLDGYSVRVLSSGEFRKLTREILKAANVLSNAIKKALRKGGIK